MIMFINLMNLGKILGATSEEVVEEVAENDSAISIQHFWVGDDFAYFRYKSSLTENLPVAIAKIDSEDVIYLINDEKINVQMYEVPASLVGVCDPLVVIRFLTTKYNNERLCVVFYRENEQENEIVYYFDFKFKKNYKDFKENKNITIDESNFDKVAKDLRVKNGFKNEKSHYISALNANEDFEVVVVRKNHSTKPISEIELANDFTFSGEFHYRLLLVGFDGVNDFTYIIANALINMAHFEQPAFELVFYNEVRVDENGDWTVKREIDRFFRSDIRMDPIPIQYFTVDEDQKTSKLNEILLGLSTHSPRYRLQTKFDFDLKRGQHFLKKLRIKLPEGLKFEYRKKSGTNMGSVSFDEIKKLVKKDIQLKDVYCKNGCVVVRFFVTDIDLRHNLYVYNRDSEGREDELVRSRLSDLEVGEKSSVFEITVPMFENKRTIRLTINDEKFHYILLSKSNYFMIEKKKSSFWFYVPFFFTGYVVLSLLFYYVLWVVYKQSGWS